MSGLDHLDYDDVEALGEVHRLVTKVIKLAGGSVPPVGSAAWWSAPDAAKVASLLVLAEARLIDDPHRIAAEQLREVSKAISGGLDWSAAAHRLAYERPGVLAARRREPGPLAALIFDPVATARWVETGSSDEAAA